MMTLVTIAFALLGGVTGSFVGVVSERIHTGQSFVHGRSRCNSCNRVLGPLDLVPVLSWVASLGRCRTCKARVPALYALLELTLAVVFAYAYLMLSLTLALAAFLAALGVLTFIVVYDLRHTIVPPSASFLLFLFSLAFLLARTSNLHVLGGAVLTAGLIALAFLLMHALSGGRAMGLGDAPVAFSLSLLAAPYAFSGLLFSFWIGALCGIVILMRQRGGPRMGVEVPFVPFLAVGYILAYFIQWNPLALF